MVDLFNRYNLSFLQTHLTKRMLLHISGSNLLPRPSISFLVSWVSLILVIPFVLQAFMLFTILLVGKVGTARIGTWFLRFVWHMLSSFLE